MFQAARRFTLIPALLLCLGAFAAPAEAQPRPPRPQPEAPEAEYDRLFMVGLQALTARNLKVGERVFKRCIKLFPDRAVSYYNLACAYALQGKTSEAVAQIRISFEKGFQDVSHLERDMDLEKIRRAPAFRKAMSDFKEQILQEFDRPLTYLPDKGKKAPILVVIHDQGGKPTSDLMELQEAFPSFAIVMPLGKLDQARNVHVWDGRAEFVITHGLRRFLREEAKRVDANRLFVIGEGAAGRIALQVSAQNPELVTGGVLVAGPGLEVAASDTDLSGLRAYLVVNEQDRREVIGGILARNALAEADCPTVLERYRLPKPFTKDRAVMLRGLSWLQGNQTSLPGSKGSREF
ncbi:MAG: tetratricopeptide repeat protein [Planctomycetes bacterium]|nr:tetratricopeptide repeat protein [Planctomycetota bacterium]